LKSALTPAEPVTSIERSTNASARRTAKQVTAPRSGIPRGIPRENSQLELPLQVLD
jgi:hypothetical protein